MTSSINLNSYNNPEETLETVYFIATSIHSLLGEYNSGKPWSNYEGNFKSGPNSLCGQTKQGLVLETYFNRPCRIHTPYGCWSILGNSSSGDWNKVFDSIKESLGLEPWEKGKQTGVGLLPSSCWAITKCREEKIAEPEYKKPSEYIPSEKVEEVWKTFIAKHSDLKTTE